MKIKTWLLSSYLVVMILPLVMAYLLFAWINTYHNDQKVKEFFSTSIELTEIKTILDNAELYQMKKERPEVDKLTSDQLSVILYNRDGFVIYASNPIYAQSYPSTRDQLYENLYSLNQGYQTYSYKQPVFDGKEIVGFFQIELAREAWVSGVTERTWFVLGLFLAIFLIIYLLVIFMVNRKLNVRLTGLKNEMTAFARGEEIEETSVNNDEIGELKQQFYSMRNQINAAQEVIDKEQQVKEYMIATISHDLKTPLTSIRAYAESLDVNENLTIQEQSEYRKVIIEKSNFMKQMLDDLLTYTLLQSPTYEMEFVQVEGDEFFEMLVSDYGLLCKEKGIKLRAFSDVKGMYEVSPKQLMRVADNLMSNAIQHASDDGEVWIFALSDTQVTPDWLYSFVKERYPFNWLEYVYLIVQNDGKGITQNKIKQVFDPLYQVDEARNKSDARGTGLGLSITQKIIEKHDGDIQIFSKEDIGTCVICRLPKLKGKGEDIEES